MYDVFNMKKIYILILLFVLSLELLGQEFRHSKVLYPKLYAYENPALKIYQYDFDYSELAVQFSRNLQSEIVLSQLGRGENVGLFEGSTYRKLQDQNDDLKSIVWGYAKYENGKRYDVCFNETSDFEKVYPYFTADSLGGDINFEKYKFNGGYALKVNKFTLGLEADYLSSRSFRKLDPRPKNISLDVKIKLGLAYSILPKYNLALSGMLGTYTQRMSVIFMDPKGGIKTYLMTGLGTHYFRFKGKDPNSLQYKGGYSGVMMSLVPENRRGLSFNFSIDRSHIGRQILEKSNIISNDSFTYTYKGDCAFTHIGQNHSFSTRLYGKYLKKNGDDRIFDNASTGSYNHISTNSLFTMRRKNISFITSYEYRISEKYRFEVEPLIGVDEISILNILPKRECKLDWKKINLTLGVSRNTEKSFMFSRIYGRYRHLSSSSLIVEEKMDEIDFIYENLEHNFDMLASDFKTVGVLTRYEYKLNKRLKSIFLMGNCCITNYHTNSHMFSILATLGVTL